MRKTFHILLLTLLVVLPVSQAFGEATPDAQKWLDKLAGIYDAGPFQAHYSSTIQANQMGQSITIEMDGDVTQGDAQHQRMVMTGKMKMPGMDSGMEMKVLSVLDGETMWTEISSAMMGGTRVMKIGIEDAQEMGQAAGGFSSAGVDPVSQIRQMSDAFDLDVAGSANGIVRLSAVMTDETKAKLGAALPDLDDTATMEILIDEKTGFVSEMRLGSDENPFMSMKFTDFKRVKRDSLDEGVFEYTPPEGATVMDMGALAGAAGGAGR